MKGAFYIYDSHHKSKLFKRCGAVDLPMFYRLVSFKGFVISMLRFTLQDSCKAEHENAGN